MKKVLKIYLLVLILPFLYGCNDNNSIPTDCSPENTILFPQDAIDRFWFTKGSWWIYTDVDTETKFDTVTVINTYQKSSSKAENGHYKNKCYTTQGLGTENSKGQILTSFFDFIGQDDVLYNQERFINQIESSDGHVFITRFRFHGNSYDSIQGSKIEILSEYSIGNEVYKDVLHLKYDTFNQLEFLDDAYWVKGIGLLKFTDRNQTTWRLSDFNVNQ